MSRIVKEIWRVNISREELIDFEGEILRALDWDLHYVTPLLFLERYQRLFGLDFRSNTPNLEKEKKYINNLSR